MEEESGWMRQDERGALGWSRSSTTMAMIIMSYGSSFLLGTCTCTCICSALTVCLSTTRDPTCRRRRRPSSGPPATGTNHCRVTGSRLRFESSHQCGHSQSSSPVQSGPVQSSPVQFSPVQSTLYSSIPVHPLLRSSTRQERGCRPGIFLDRRLLT
jgi:hypothetical protein